MCTFIIGFLVGGLVFGVLVFLVGNSKSEDTKTKEPKYTRRGIWTNDYSIGPGDKKNLLKFNLN